MNKIIIFVISVSIYLVLSGCSTKDRNIYIKEYVEVKNNIPIVNKPVKPMVQEIRFEVKDGVVYLTDQNYKRLGYNLLEVSRYIKNVNSILDYYEDKINKENTQ